MHSRKTKGNLILLFTALIWGFAFAFQNEAGQLITPYFFGAFRMTMATIAVGIVSFIVDVQAGKLQGIKVFESEEKNREYKRATIVGGIICGIGMGFATTLQQMGLMYTSAGRSGFITALYIILVPIGAALVFKSKIHVKVWIAVLIAIVGMYLLCVSPGEGFDLNKGDILTAVCAVCFAVQILCADVFVPKANPIKIAVIEFAVIAAGSWVLAFIFEDPNWAMIKAALIPVLYCGLISGAMGYTCQLIGQKYTDPTSASLIMSFEAVFAVVGGVVIQKQVMPLREMIGCVIMFAAIILVQLPSKEERKKQ